MTTFIQFCLYAYAVCAATGLGPAAVLAAKSRSLAGVLLSFLVAAFTIWVLITAAVML